MTGNYSVADTKENVSATEFIRWGAYFDKEWTEQNRTIYQLALIAYQSYLLMFILGGTPTRTINDFVLDFSKLENDLESKQKDLIKEAEEAKRKWEVTLGAFGTKGKRDISRGTKKKMIDKVSKAYKTKKRK